MFRINSNKYRIFDFSVEDKILYHRMNTKGSSFMIPPQVKLLVLVFMSEIKFDLTLVTIIKLLP